MGFRLLRKLVILALVLLVTGTASLFAISPKRIYQQGEKAEASGDLDGAFAAYAAASRTQPNEIQYQQAMERLRFIAAEAHVHAGEHQLEIGNTTDALREFLHALDIDPGSAVARQDLQKAQDLVKDKDGEAKTSVTAAGGNERPAAPPHLELKPQELLTMQMVEQSTVLYQTLGRVAGINVLIDPDYHAVRVALDVKGVTVLEALHILDELSNSFWKPVTRNTIFVAANTPAKRKSLQVEAMQIFYLSNVAQQSDLNDVQTALRNILTGAKIYAVPSQNAIVLKGTADEIQLAKTMIHALDRTRPEVLVDVYVLQVKRDK